MSELKRGCVSLKEGVRAELRLSETGKGEKMSQLRPTCDTWRGDGH